MTIQEIKKVVENNSGLIISKKSRKREYINARAVYYRLCKDLSNESLYNIGKLVNVDHATVLSSLRKENEVKDLDAKKLYLSCKKKALDYLEIVEDNTGNKDEVIKSLKTKILNAEISKKNKVKNYSNNIKNKDLNYLLSLDSETIELFCNTRLKPFLKMLETHKTNKDLILYQHKTRKM